MEASRRHRRTSWFAAALAMFVLCCGPPPAGATETVLVVQLSDGQNWTYPLAELERLTFENDELLVISVTGTDPYPLESIARVDLLLDESTGLEDPEDAADLLAALHLFQNHPNPFNPETRIAFELPAAGRAELRIYAVNGQLVRTLVAGELASGPHSVHWNGRDDAGDPVSSGVYFYLLAAPGVEESRKMILLR